MYFWNTRFEDSNFGLQGDVQHRNWDLGGDLEQLLIRGGATYSPDQSNLLYTLGYASITSGQFGRAERAFNMALNNVIDASTKDLYQSKLNALRNVM